MDWLSQNWIWILLFVGGYFLMMRMGGCGMGHAMGRGHGNDAKSDHDHNAHDHSAHMHAGADARQLEAPGQDCVIDPVSKRAVSANALSCLYEGRAYFFESRETRDAFESDPGKYISASLQMAGPVATPSNPAPQRPRRSHGCC